MRLAACYNTWGDVYLLKHSIENIRPLVDLIIIVFSTTSNFGERLNPDESDGSAFKFPDGCPIYFRQMEPNLKLGARDNETMKRNYGLQVAREMGATHFLSMDADECYEPEPFLKLKEMFKNPEVKGLVCTCTTLFRRPTLSIGLDVTLVPFIHELTPTIKHEFNRRYPCAWNGNQILIDPTRSMNINSGVVLIRDFTMHHFSWIRSDYKRKIRNSTARFNLERSTIVEDLVNAKDGYFVKFYQKRLSTVSNRFNIPEYGDLDQDLLKSRKPLAATDKKD
jgi:hypothetical protein